MTTRPDFLKGTTAAATGIVFCGCGMLEAAHARHPGGRRLPVAVNGKRIKTIDVHAHCYFRESTSLVSPESIFTPPTDATRDSFIEIESRLKAMDAQAVDMEVLSINPFWYDKDRDLAGQIVKIQNEKSPEAIRHLVAQVGASQIVMGSDFPYPWELHPVDHIFACTFLSAKEKNDILGTTATRLLNIRT